MPSNPAIPRALAQRRTAIRVAACVAATVLTVTGVPLVTGAGLDRAAAAGTTVTGTVSGRHAWDPHKKAVYPDTPTVTVDQTTELADQVVHVTWNNFTPSASTDGGDDGVFSAGTTDYAVTVLECRTLVPGDPTTWTGTVVSPDCYGHVAGDASAQDGDGNQVYAVTGRTGEGEAYFHVETSASNNFLGCSSTHPCSLVVVPNWGGVQPGVPPSDAGVDCDDHRYDGSKKYDFYARDDSLGQACSWTDRLVVPLHFAPTPAACPNSNYAFATEGAPMLARTFQQWQAGWCTQSDPLIFDYDSGTNEYLARQSFLYGAAALTSGVDSAITTQSAGSGGTRPFAYAPIANSAITVAFHIDDGATGRLITDLTLDARLVAKLITQSYSLGFTCGGTALTSGPTCDPAVAGNPVSIFDDPEFQALNPQYARSDFPFDSQLNRGQFMPLVVGGNSDLVYELTRWIDSDAQARAFIAGKSDGYGMHVNTYYKNEPFPLDQFQNLDPGYTAPNSNGYPGVSTMQVSWNPINGLDQVALSLVEDKPSAVDPTLACDSSGVCNYKRFGPVAQGQRALFAIVGLDDAAADRFPTASLVNAAGDAVAPTAAAVAAGHAYMSTDADGVTQSADYANPGTGAYPLVTSSYAMVPKCGVTPAKAAAMKNFLAKVASSQTLGLEPGQLAPGNIPLTPVQRTQLASAAAAISTTACPASRSGGAQSGGGTSHDGGSVTTAAGSGGTSGVAAAGRAAARSSSAAHPGGGTVSTPSGDATPAVRALAAYGVKRGDGSGGLGFALPMLLVLSTLLIVGAPGLYLLLQTGSGQQTLARLRARLRP